MSESAFFLSRAETIELEVKADSLRVPMFTGGFNGTGAEFAVGLAGGFGMGIIARISPTGPSIFN